MMGALGSHTLPEPTPAPMAKSFYTRATYFIVSALVATLSLAQAPAQTETEPVAVETPQVAQLVQQAASEDPVQSGDAIASLARMGNWSRVGESLERTAAQKPDDVKIAKIANSLGPVILPLLNRDNLINSSALEFVAELNKAVAKENDDPQVRQLREAASAGNSVQAAQAVTSLVRIGNWFAADEILAEAATQKPDEATAAEMARRLGPALLVRMSRSDKLNQSALDFVSQLSAALANENASPERLRLATEDLFSDQADVRLNAMRVLLSGGDASIRELVSAIVSDKTATQRDELLRTMLQLGDGGVLALRQLAIYGATDERPRALASLARIDRQRFTSDLVSALHAANSTDEERKIAFDAFARMNLSAPSHADSIIYLADELSRANEAARLAVGDETLSVIWEIDADRKTVRSVETRASIAASRERADLAARLLRLDSVPRILAQDALIADVSYRVSADPLWGSPEEVKALSDAYGATSAPAAASVALAEALQREDWTAVVGLIQFTQAASNQIQVNEWLSGQAGQPAPLVRAAMAPIPRVRYEAVAAITKLKPEMVYAGSSHVQETLAEMARLTRRPVAIIVETIPEFVSLQETLLTTIGFQVDTVVTVAELERRVAAGGDLRLVLSKSGLADARPIELVDRVRRLPRGGKLPIIFYTDEEDVLGSNLFSAPTVQMPVPRSVRPLTELLIQWQRVAALPPLIEAERNLFQSLAREALGIDEAVLAETAP